MTAARLAAISPLPVIGFGEYHVTPFPIKIRCWGGVRFLFLVRFLHKKTPSGKNGVHHIMVQVLHLDLNVNTAGQFQFHQGINRLGAVGIDVHQALERAELKLLTGLLVHVGRAQHRKDFLLGRERNRTANNGTGCFHCAHDLLRRFVDQIVIVRLELDSDFLVHTFYYLAAPFTSSITFSARLRGTGA